MTKEDIIKMAREAWDRDTDFWLTHEQVFLERFAALVRAAEQDRCCSIVIGMAGSDNVAQRTVDAIRGKK